MRLSEKQKSLLQEFELDLIEGQEVPLYAPNLNRYEHSRRTLTSLVDRKLIRNKNYDFYYLTKSGRKILECLNETEI